MKMYAIKYTNNDGHVSYYCGSGKHGIDTDFFLSLGFRVSSMILHWGRLEDAKKFKTKKQAKEEMQKVNIDYYGSDCYEIVEVEV